MRLTFDQARRDPSSAPPPYDLQLGVVARLRLLDDDGRLVYEEHELPVVELALALEDWLASDLGRGVAFSFDSMETAGPDQLWCRPAAGGWLVGAADQVAPDPTVRTSDEVAEALVGFVRSVDSWLDETSGLRLDDARPRPRHAQGFPRSWRITRVDAPGDGRVDLVVGDTSRGRVQHLLVEPAEGSRHLVAVAQDPGGEHGITGVQGTPDPRLACLLLGGSAFLLDVQNLGRSSRLALDGSVREVVELVDDHLLLLATAWSITAVGDGRVVWTTDRLAVESLRLEGVRGHRLHGVADPDDEARPFTVDLRTGAVDGGPRSGPQVAV